MQDENNIEVASIRTEAVAIWAPFLLDRVAGIKPEIYSMSETELESHFKPTSCDFFLRKRFWEATESFRLSGETGVSISEIYKNICSRQHFYTIVLKNEYRLSWILLPIQKHMDMIEEGLYFALKRVREELLTMPVNEKTAGHLLKALDFYANRALGPVIQRIEQKSMNVNINGNKIADSVDTETLMQKYDELKSKLLKPVEEPFESEQD